LANNEGKPILEGADGDRLKFFCRKLSGESDT
jgi:hypothetical protein